MKIGILSDSLAAHNLLMCDPWPMIAERALRHQGKDVQFINLAIDGMNFRQTTAAPYFGTTEENKLVSSGCDAFLVALGNNDGLFNIEVQTAPQIQANCAALFQWLRLCVPSASLINVAMRAVPIGVNANYDALLTYAQTQAALTPQHTNVDIPLFNLYTMGLGLNDGPIFNLSPGPGLPNLPHLHLTGAGQRMLAAWFLKQTATLFGYQMQPFPAWNDPDQAFIEFNGSTPLWQTLKANWNAP